MLCRLDVVWSGRCYIRCQAGIVYYLCGDDEGSDLVVVTLCLTYVDVCVCDL